MIKLTDKIFAFKVPEGAKGFLILSDIQPQAISYDYMGEQRERDTQWLNATIDLPPGSYTFLFCTSNATEEQARKVVRELPVGKRWENYCGDYPVWCQSALESLRSWLKANGCEGEFAVVRRK